MLRADLFCGERGAGGLDRDHHYGEGVIISGFRLVASDSGVVIAANYWGKFKTVSQMIMIILIILDIEALSILTQIFIYLALALTVISLEEYIRQNINVLKEGGA